MKHFFNIFVDNLGAFAVAFIYLLIYRVIIPNNWNWGAHGVSAVITLATLILIFSQKA